METDQAAVACSLGTRSMKSRSDQWRDLLTPNLGEIASIPGGVRFTLRGSSAVAAELNRLIALENACCAWINWSVVRGQSLQVDATAEQEAGVVLLRNWFGEVEENPVADASRGRFRAYIKRPIRFQKLSDINGWRLKVYGIAYNAPHPAPELVEAITAAAKEHLPQPARTESRYGVGFICAHQGRTASVAFVDWWENEDELHHKMFIADEQDLSQLRSVADDELTACSWDLAVIGFERNAWVRHILQAPQPDLEAYLNEHLNEDV